MKVELIPQITRTLVPIQIKVTEINSQPTVVIKSLNSKQNSPDISLTLPSTPTGFRTEFWLQQTGNYEVIVQHKAQTVKKSLQITEQEFMSFNVEFGIFSILLSLATVGIVIWQKNKRKKL